MGLFKVWSRNRQQKTFILVNEEDSLLENFILKANEKLKLNGDRIVLEKDGTLVDEEEILRLLRDEIFILLQPGEDWVSFNNSDTESLASSSSTVTLLSTSTLSNNSDVTKDTPLDPFPSMEFQNTFNTQDAGNSGPDIVITDIPLLVTNEDFWHNISVPWDKFSPTILTACEEGKRTKLITTEIVQTIVNEMRTIKTNIPSKAFKIIARKMVDRYPKMFKDYDEDGTVIGDGTHTIYNKLQDRNSYLNRPHKRRNEETFVVPPIPAKKAKKIANARAGCSNWAPPVQINESINNRDILNNMDETEPQFWTLLEQTFPEQRTFFNNVNPTVAQLKEQWPVLLRENVVYWHFKTLTGVNMELPGDFELKVSRILRYAEKKKIPYDPNEETTVSCLKIVCHHFKENFSRLCREIKAEDDLEDIMAPSVVKNKNDHYLVVMEKQVLINQEKDDFSSAIAMAFAFYFLMNLEYPKELQHTMEFIQRYVFKIHPDSGTRSKSAVRDKIFKFIHQLAACN